MKATRTREINHIVANFSLRKKATRYRIDSYSMTMEAIYDLFRARLIKCVKFTNSFLWVIPTKLIHQVGL